MNRQYVPKFVGVLAALGFVGMTVPSQAQTVTPFQLVGHIQSFCLDNQVSPVTGNCLTTADKEALAAQQTGGNTNDPRRVDKASVFIGARLMVNGILVTIPSNLILQFPAAYFTPQQAFANAQGVSAKYQESGLALHDKFPPLAAFEVTVDGNIVNGSYIAGLVSISQQSLNTSGGHIHSIDFNTGILCVGGTPTATTCGAGDTRIRLNDPVLSPPDPATGDGRYGKPNPVPPPVGADDPNSRYPDPRFTVDQGNPTVHALTGYPMCVPRSANDAKCPDSNRPTDNTFVMDAQPLPVPIKFGNTTISPCAGCKSTLQAPFRVGDYVTYAGTLARDLVGPLVSVHTMVANVGIYTKPGADPAYVTLEESLIGTMGPIKDCNPPAGAVPGAECQDRIKVEGFTTDPSRTVNIYALDSSSGRAPQVRLLHSTAKEQAVFGRFRWITGKRAGVLFDANGAVRGATRELMARIDSNGTLPDGSPVPDPPNVPVANGLTPGIYIAPVAEYIFPEPTGIQGGPQPPLNFECLAFLVNGWGLPGNVPTISPLTPWPGTTPATLACNK